MTDATGMSGATKRSVWTQRACTVAIGLALGLALVEPTWAQLGGGNGTGTIVQARATAVLTTVQAIIFGVGGLVLASAFGWVGYGMAFNGKKWSDVANVAYGALIAGGCSMLVGWLFS